MKKKILLAFTMASLVIPQFGMTAVLTVDQMTDYIYANVAEKTNFDELNQYGFTDAQMYEVKRNALIMFKNKDLIRYLVKEWDQLGWLDTEAIPKEQLTEVFENNTLAVSQALFLQGLKRLPCEDQKVFIRFLVEGADSLTTSECYAFFNGVGTKERLEKVTAKVMRSRTPSQLREYLAVYRKAVFAEVADYPSKRELSQEQYQYAQLALERSIRNQLGKLPEDVQERILRGADDPSLQSEESNCELIRLVYRAAFDIEGKVADWVLLTMILDMS